MFFTNDNNEIHLHRSLSLLDSEVLKCTYQIQLNSKSIMLGYADKLRYSLLKTSEKLRVALKEKHLCRLSEWKNDFRNLTAKVRANLDNPIKSYDFSKFLVNFLYAALSGGTVLISVMSQQLQLSNGTVHKFYNIFTFHENVSSLYFYTYM